MRERFRWGILGTAGIAVKTIKAIQTGGCGELVAIASRDLDKSNDWACEHGIPLAFDSYDAMLKSGEVDLIYNPLPNSLHAKWTIKALRAGHCVLCEKPIALNAAEAQAIADAAEETGLHVAEAFMYRFHPQFQRAAELIESGVIGKVSTLYSCFTFMNDDPNANLLSKEMGGGALMDVGCYCVDFSRLIAGCEPVRVSALEARKEVDETMLGLLEFPNGVLAQFETSIANFERHGAIINGTEGSIELFSPWVSGEKNANIICRREGQAPEIITVEPANSYYLQAAEFCRVANGEGGPTRPITHAVLNMKVIDALFASCRESRVVEIN